MNKQKIKLKNKKRENMKVLLRGRRLKKINIEGIEYLLDEELGRLVRVLEVDGERVDLISDFISSIRSDVPCSANIYAIHKDGVCLMDNRESLDKSLPTGGINEFLATGRNPIFYKATIAQILRIKADTVGLFTQTKKYSLVA